MGRSIAVASGKGGTGKTMIAANLGVALAKMGRDVILIDADITFANIGFVFGIEEPSATLQSVLAKEESIENAIYNGPDGLKIVPSGHSLEALKRLDLDLFRDVLASLSERAEYILVDVPPGLEKIAVTSLSAADEILLVITPDLPSIASALKTKYVAEKFDTQLLGVVVNRVLKSREVNKKEIEAIFEGEVLAVIPEDPEVRKALSSGSPLVLTSPKSPASKEIYRLAGKIAGIDIVENEKGFFKKLFKKG